MLGSVGLVDPMQYGAGVGGPQYSVPGPVDGMNQYAVPGSPVPQYADPSPVDPSTTNCSHLDATRRTTAPTSVPYGIGGYLAYNPTFLADSDARARGQEGPAASVQQQGLPRDKVGEPDYHAEAWVKVLILCVRFSFSLLQCLVRCSDNKKNLSFMARFL